VTSASEQALTDRDVRLFVYRDFLSHGAPPSISDTARALRVSNAEVGESYDRLAAGRVIVLRPGTRRIIMAAPLSAVETRFRVALADGRSLWANCVWDALGVAAMLYQDATIHASCGDCDEALTLTVQHGKLERADGVVHFAVPAAQWWDDIVFT
jgi:DNA-binding transcriptional MocR family regulator